MHDLEKFWVEAEDPDWKAAYEVRQSNKGTFHVELMGEKYHWKAPEHFPPLRYYYSYQAFVFCIPMLANWGQNCVSTSTKGDPAAAKKPANRKVRKQRASLKNKASRYAKQNPWFPIPNKNIIPFKHLIYGL